MSKFQRHLLQTTLQERQQRNSSYSLRAFARDLSLSATTLSRVLSGNRMLSLEAVETVATNLNLSAEAKVRFVSESKREEPKQIDFLDHHLLDDVQFSVVSEWYYYAVLSLCEHPEARYESSWFADKLNIAPELISECLEHLVQGKYIGRTPNNSLILLSPPLANAHAIPSSAARQRHVQIMTMAIESLEKDSPDVRPVSSTTSLIDPDNIPQARVMISNFRRKLFEFLETGRPRQVYEFASQLFPVSKECEAPHKVSKSKEL